MGRLSANQALAVAVVERLRASGVRTFCVCPGGRNAPLIEALDKSPLFLMANGYQAPITARFGVKFLF